VSNATRPTSDALLRFPSGECDVPSAPRSLGGGAWRRRTLRPSVDELRVYSQMSGGHKTAMDLPGTLLKAGDTDVALDVMQGWAAPMVPVATTPAGQSGSSFASATSSCITKAPDRPAHYYAERCSHSFAESARNGRRSCISTTTTKTNSACNSQASAAGSSHQAHGPSARIDVTLFSASRARCFKWTLAAGRRLQCDQRCRDSRRRLRVDRQRSCLDLDHTGNNFISNSVPRPLRYAGVGPSGWRTCAQPAFSLLGSRRR